MPSYQGVFHHSHHCVVMGPGTMRPAPLTLAYAHHMTAYNVEDVALWVHHVCMHCTATNPILSTAWQFPCIRNLYPQSCSCTAICHCRMCKYTSPSNLVCGSLSSWRSPRKWVCVCLKNPFVPYIEKTCGRLCIYWLELSRTEMQNLYKFLGISATWENSALIHFVHALTLHALIARVNSCCFIHC